VIVSCDRGASTARSFFPMFSAVSRLPEVVSTSGSSKMQLHSRLAQIVGQIVNDNRVQTSGMDAPCYSPAGGSYQKTAPFEISGNLKVIPPSFWTAFNCWTSPRKGRKNPLPLDAPAIVTCAPVSGV